LLKNPKKKCCSVWLII